MTEHKTNWNSSLEGEFSCHRYLLPQNIKFVNSVAMAASLPVSIGYLTQDGFIEATQMPLHHQGDLCEKYLTLCTDTSNLKCGLCVLYLNRSPSLVPRLISSYRREKEPGYEATDLLPPPPSSSSQPALAGIRCYPTQILSMGADPVAPLKFLHWRRRVISPLRQANRNLSFLPGVSQWKNHGLQQEKSYYCEVVTEWSGLLNSEV